MTYTHSLRQVSLSTCTNVFTESGPRGNVLGPPMGIAISGGATPGRARSNDLAGRSTALAPPCVLLCFGNSVNRKKCYHIWPRYLFVLFWRWKGVGGGGRQQKRSSTFFEKKSAFVRMTDLAGGFSTSKWPGSFTALAPPLTAMWQPRFAHGHSLGICAPVPISRW